MGFCAEKCRVCAEQQCFFPIHFQHKIFIVWNAGDEVSVSFRVKHACDAVAAVCCCCSANQGNRLTVQLLRFSNGCAIPVHVSKFFRI